MESPRNRRYPNPAQWGLCRDAFESRVLVGKHVIVMMPAKALTLLITVIYCGTSAPSSRGSLQYLARLGQKWFCDVVVSIRQSSSSPHLTILTQAWLPPGLVCPTTILSPLSPSSRTRPKPLDNCLIQSSRPYTTRGLGSSCPMVILNS
jgi:hypothetical protein